MIRPWWEEFPGLLESELRALERAGIPYQKNKAASQAGVLRLDLRVTVDGRAIPLFAVYPDLYPYFRPEVYAPTLNLPHHQNPIRKNLCLLPRSTGEWDVEADALATLLTEQLPRTLQAGETQDPEVADGLEQHQAEPFADYYSYPPGPFVIADGSCPIPGRYKAGSLLIGTCTPGSKVLRGAVLEVQSDRGEALARCDEGLRRAWSRQTVAARWVRLEQPPQINDPGRLFSSFRDLDPHPNRIDSVKVDDGRLQVRAALFPQELRGWRTPEDGWLFACRFEPEESWRNKRKNKRKERKRRKRRK